MTERFAESAARLAGLAPRALGWRPGDLWDATPAELALIFQAEPGPAVAPVTRTELSALMERDRHG